MHRIILMLEMEIGNSLKTSSDMQIKLFGIHQIKSSNSKCKIWRIFLKFIQLKPYPQLPFCKVGANDFESSYF